MINKINYVLLQDIIIKLRQLNFGDILGIKEIL